MNYEITQATKAIIKKLDELEQRTTEIEDNMDKHINDTNHPHEA